MKLYVIKNKAGRYYDHRASWSSKQCDAVVYTTRELEHSRRDILDAGERLVRLRRRTSKQEREDVLKYLAQYSDDTTRSIRHNIAAGRHVRKQ